MLKTILIGLATLVVAFAAYVALQPTEFRVKRSTSIAAPADAVFANVNDFKKWDAWSPWADRDPDAKVNFEGSPSGNGAIFNWSGNAEVGEGHMMIVDSKPNEAIQIKLDFLKPFPGTSDVTFEPDGANTNVTWSFAGNRGFLERAMCTIMGLNMDRMIGDNYEKGLAKLKALAETRN